ncbi:hypothetical protein [Nitrosomonas communis]|nr:hypothetical protein [Nitrosomonas communis]
MNDQIAFYWSLGTMLLAVMFGLLGQPTEMGIIVLAGAISFAFLNIDKIQRFKGAGFEAEMREIVNNANATIEQLRDVATLSSEAILTSLMADNFFDGTTLATRIKLHDQIIESLKKIGASDIQVSQANQMWNKGMRIIFHRGIRQRIEEMREKNGIDAEQKERFRSVSNEFQELLRFEEWIAPTANEIEAFIRDKGLIDDEINELLLDYREFEVTGKFRRKNVLVGL